MYTPIVGTLGYILSPDRKQVLLIHRTGRPDDQHLGKYNGLGGKMKAGEDIWSCMEREIREESGLTVEEMVLRGVISWPGFGPHGEDWLGFIFLITAFQGHCYASNDEGVLGWYPLDALDGLPMWEGDRYFLPLVFDENPAVFYGCMPSRNGRPAGWSYRR